jgi:hypothetical protein
LQRGAVARRSSGELARARALRDHAIHAPLSAATLAQDPSGSPPCLDPSGLRRHGHPRRAGAANVHV